MVSCAPYIIYPRSIFTAYTYPCSRIWSLPSGQCLKTLAEGHDAIWYEALRSFHHSRLTLFGHLVNTCSSPRIRNTSSPPPTTAPSACGTSRLRAVSRRTSATKIQSTASPPASASREASGSSQAAKIAKSTCGTCRAERSCRFLMVTAVRAFFHLANYYFADRPPSL
jgi:hypothetical protein